MPCLDAFLAVFVLVGAARRLLLAHARPLGDAVADVAHRIEARHVLLLQEIDGVAFALGKQRDQHIGAGHFVAAGILHMQDRALNDALKSGRGLCVLAVFDDERDQFLIDIFRERPLQRLADRRCRPS